MTSARISVRVSGKIVQRLKERSRKTGVKESEVVRDAIEEYLSKSDSEKTAYERAVETGLIGCAKGLPRDLSANKKYFKGFGKSR
jgi:metal-responsive CopG/Arc/MetJ family transcriptional regulator